MAFQRIVTNKIHTTVVMEEVNWGIIGCGNVTEKKSGPAFSKASGSNLLAVMRRTEAKARDYAVRHGVPAFYTDVDLLLSHPNLNAVYIATPPDTHAEYAIKAMQAGKVAYVEKPMALTPAECEQMIRVSSETGQPLFVAYYRRLLPEYLKIKELIESGEIGQVKLVKICLHHSLKAEETNQNQSLGWRVNPAISGGGHFHDLAAHQLDYLEYLFGEAIDVKGIALNQAGCYPADDMVAAAFRFQSGVAVSGSWCFTVPEALRDDTTEIIGSEGRIVFSFFAHTDILVEKSAGSAYTLSVPPPEHIQQPLIQSIVDELRGKGKCPSTGQTGIRATILMDQITNGSHTSPQVLKF